MKGKKLLTLIGSVCLILVLGVLPFTAACGPAEEPTPPGEETPIEGGEVYELRFASSEQGPLVTESEQLWTDLVNYRGQGRVKMTYYPHGVLGGPPENLEDVSAGVIDITMAGTGGLTRYVPWESLRGDLPFAWTSWPAYLRWLTEIVNPELNKDLAAFNMINLPSFGAIGSCSIYSRVGPIHTVSDVKGKIFRAMGSGAETQWMEALGAKPTVLPWAELYPALEQGVIDLMHNPPSYGVISGFFEVCKDLTVTGHKIFAFGMVANSDKWNSLPEDLQTMIIYSLVESHQELSWAHWCDEAFVLEVAQQPPYNVNVYYPTPEEWAEFKEAVAPVYEWARSEYGDEKVDLVTKYAR